MTTYIKAMQRNGRLFWRPVSDNRGLSAEDVSDALVRYGNNGQKVLAALIAMKGILERGALRRGWTIQ